MGRQGGALQISSARKDASAVTDEDLKEFASERVPSAVQLQGVSIGDFLGFAARYKREDRVWQEWWLRSGKVMVYVTYNVEEGQDTIAQEALSNILSTLRVRRTSA